MLRTVSGIVVVFALACTDALAPAPPQMIALNMLEVSAALDLLSERPGWAFVRVGVTIENFTDQSVLVRMPSEPRACVLVRIYRDGTATPDFETPGVGCRGQELLRPQARTRLLAEPAVAFGPPPYPTTAGETYIVTAQILDIGINHEPPLNSDEVYAGTVRVQWGSPQS